MYSHSLEPISQTCASGLGRRPGHWTDNDWDNCSFTDESRYCLDVTDQCVRAWRRRGERFQDASISEHDRVGPLAMVPR